METKGAIIDFNRTLYDPNAHELIDGCIELLEELKNKGLKMVLVSKENKRQNSARRLSQIKDLGLDQFFTAILVINGEKTKVHFQECLKIINLNPKQVIVIGDRVRVEIQLGNFFGMTTFWYQAGKFAFETPRNRLEQPNFIIRKLSDISELTQI